MLIQNALIYDGVTPVPYEGDLSIQDGKLCSVGPRVSPADGEQVIDAAGLRVYPCLLYTSPSPRD